MDYRKPLPIKLDPPEEGGSTVCSSSSNLQKLSEGFQSPKPHPAQFPSKLVVLAKTKSGSKKLQSRISNASLSQLDQIVQSLGPNLPQLMTNTYGNYMCQSLFQAASPVQRVFLLRNIIESSINLACDIRGTHSFQALISLASLPEEEKLYQQAFQGSIYYLSVHQFGSHVLQKLLVTLRNKQFIIQELRGNIVALSTHPLGVCVVKRCIQDYNIYKEVVINALLLIQDPFGNYCIQKVLETWGEASLRPLAEKLRNSVAQLCVQKYSSNVIEKCMHFEYLREQFLNEVLVEEKFQVVVNSSFGCYVLISAAQQGATERVAEALKRSGHVLHQRKLRKRWLEICQVVGIEPFFQYVIERFQIC